MLLHQHSNNSESFDGDRLLCASVCLLRRQKELQEIIDEVSNNSRECRISGYLVNRVLRYCFLSEPYAMLLIDRHLWFAGNEAAILTILDSKSLELSTSELR